MRVQLLRLSVAWADSGRMTMEDMVVVAKEYERQDTAPRPIQPDSPGPSSGPPS